jgi:hypothetical protein
MTWHFPSVDAWQKPRFRRCPLCAAMLLNDADASLHAEWHRRLDGGGDAKLGKWDLI